MPLSLVGLVYGAWGAATFYLLAYTYLLRSKMTEKDQAIANYKEAIRSLADDKRKAVADLVDARKIFDEQIARPCVAYFNPAQVADLAKTLTKLLFAKNFKVQ